MRAGNGTEARPFQSAERAEHYVTVPETTCHPDRCISVMIMTIAGLVVL
jgi:hypothetical protein